DSRRRRRCPVIFLKRRGTNRPRAIYACQAVPVARVGQVSQEAPARDWSLLLLHCAAAAGLAGPPRMPRRPNSLKETCSRTFRSAVVRTPGVAQDRLCVVARVLVASPGVLLVKLLEQTLEPVGHGRRQTVPIQ